MINNIDNNSCFVYTIQQNQKTVKEIMYEKLKFSKKLSRKLEINRHILLNDKTTKLRKKTYIGDKLCIVFDDEEDEYEAVNIPINIIYEDMDLLIVNKPPKIVVHPTKSHYNNTIANGVSYYFNQKGIKKKVRLVNRLDMNTSGIVVIAKNPYAHNRISDQMRENKVEKYYYAIAEGVIEKNKDTINEPIARLTDDIVRVVHTSGKECITHYEVIKRLENATLLKIKLDTGRTHQIRVHMKHIGHPVVGDTLYGTQSNKIDRQALHCYKLIFMHPRTQERIEIEAPMPEDMRLLMQNSK